MIFLATFYLAKSNKACEVKVNILGQDLFIYNNNDEVLLAQHALENTQLSSKLAALPRELTFNDGSKLMVAHNIAIDNFFPAPKSHRILHFLEQKKLAWLIAAILIPFSIYFIVAKLIPEGAKAVAPLLSHEYKVKIDEQFMATLDYILLNPSELTAQEKLTATQQWQDIEKALAVPEGKYRLLLRFSPKLGANAFALPGGTIVVTDKLYQLLEKNKNALTAVLLHEMGHVEHNHSMQMIAETTGATLLMSYFFGDLDGILEIFSGSSLALIQNSFSRNLEEEADQYALSQLQVMNISPSAFADALQSLKEGDLNQESELEKYFSSHPLIKDRIKKAHLAAEKKP